MSGTAAASKPSTAGRNTYGTHPPVPMGEVRMRLPQSAVAELRAKARDLRTDTPAMVV